MRASHESGSAPEHDRTGVRASDADRETSANRLRAAASEGRLSPDELEQRLQAAYCAKTHEELEWLVCDLPGDPEPTQPRRLWELVPSRAKIAVALAAVVVMALLLIAGAAGVGLGRSGGSSSVAAPQQAQAPAQPKTPPP